MILTIDLRLSFHLHFIVSQEKQAYNQTYILQHHDCMENFSEDS